MAKVKVAAWFLAIVLGLLVAVSRAQEYPLCPFTGLPPSKPNVTVSRCLDASEMTCCDDCSDRRYALAEVSANVTTLISTIDPRLLKLLKGDVQICSSFVSHRECLDVLEQMICATGCNPDSGKYLELPPGEMGLMRVCAPYAQELYDKCKDVALPGFQGSISHYFNSAEKLITIMFRRVGQAFNALNYTVKVSPTSEGTDKCYNGPTRLPEIDACCDPLPTTPDCPITKLNVTSFPQFVPFIGRTIADPTCPTAQSRASAADSPAVGSPSPPPPKLVVRSRACGVGFSLFLLATAASFLLVM
ncbi:unnamed protein product [Closterium sp. NIES-54]